MTPTGAVSCSTRSYRVHLPAVARSGLAVQLTTSLGVTVYSGRDRKSDAAAARERERETDMGISFLLKTSIFQRHFPKALKKGKCLYQRKSPKIWQYACKGIFPKAFPKVFSKGYFKAFHIDRYGNFRFVQNKHKSKNPQNRKTPTNLKFCNFARFSLWFGLFFLGFRWSDDAGFV